MIKDDFRTKDRLILVLWPGMPCFANLLHMRIEHPESCVSEITAAIELLSLQNEVK